MGNCTWLGWKREADVEYKNVVYRNEFTNETSKKRPVGFVEETNCNNFGDVVVLVSHGNTLRLLCNESQ